MTCPVCQQPDCPEQLSGQWFLCTRCGDAYELDREGSLLRTRKTQHSAVRPFNPIIRDAQGRIYIRDD